jgi:hypothetical protein
LAKASPPAGDQAPDPKSCDGQLFSDLRTTAAGTPAIILEDEVKCQEVRAQKPLAA